MPDDSGTGGYGRRSGHEPATLPGRLPGQGRALYAGLVHAPGRSLPARVPGAAGPGSILDTVRDPALAAELTLQPLRRYGVDAAVLFSDIVVPLVGFGVDVAPGTGPVVEKPFRDGGGPRPPPGDTGPLCGRDRAPGDPGTAMCP